MLQRFSELGDGASLFPGQGASPLDLEGAGEQLLSALLAEDGADKAQFEAWVQQLQQQQAPGQQGQQGEEADLLSQAAAAEQQVGSLLSQANQDFAALAQLLRQTLGTPAGAEGGAQEDDGAPRVEELSDDQVSLGRARRCVRAGLRAAATFVRP